MRKLIVSAAVTAGLAAVMVAPAAQSAEVVLKGISAWPKNFPLTANDFLPFIKEANKRGKGHFKIQHIGGPEISKAPAQPKGFKAGLYDLMHTAASYHRGIVPEVDALSATQLRPWDARKNGGVAALDSALKKKLGGIMLAQTATSVGFNLYLRRAPTRTADGGVSLKGFKMRSVPIYDAFLQSLGASTVTIQVPEIYNALERGLLDGFAFPALFTRKFGWAKFVKFRVLPTFYQLEPCIFLSNKAMKKISKEGVAILQKAGRDWERTSYNNWKPLVEAERKILGEKFGQKEIILTGAAAKKYIDLANTTPIKRLKTVKSAEAKTLSKIYHGQ